MQVRTGKFYAESQQLRPKGRDSPGRPGVADAIPGAGDARAAAVRGNLARQTGYLWRTRVRILVRDTSRAGRRTPRKPGHFQSVSRPPRGFCDSLFAAVSPRLPRTETFRAAVMAPIRAAQRSQLRHAAPTVLGASPDWSDLLCRSE